MKQYRAKLAALWNILMLLEYEFFVVNVQEAIQEISEYIEVFYNRQRRQARLGYLSPAAYEQEFYKYNLAA